MAARLVSLDVYRGLAVAGMILVTNAGNWNAVYWPLSHAAWNGWTPTDLIFPSFLFIVGVAMTLSFAARIEGGARRGTLGWHVLRRSLVLSRGDPMIFIQRPISAVLLSMTVIAVALIVVPQFRKSREEAFQE